MIRDRRQGRKPAGPVSVDSSKCGWRPSHAAGCGGPCFGSESGSVATALAVRDGRVDSGARFGSRRGLQADRLASGARLRPSGRRAQRRAGGADPGLAGAGADVRAIEGFCARLRSECPPLARIDSIERAPLAGAPETDGFVILASEATTVRTGVVPDAATCPECAREIQDPADRRFRYPFANCTHCGPRLSIVRAIPYDRANTSMAAFPLCPACAAEYGNPADRRFHAQPNACPDVRAPGLADWPLGDRDRPGGGGCGGRHCAREPAPARGPDPGHQRDRRFPPGLRCRQRRRGGGAAPSQAALSQALRPHGPGPGDDPPLLPGGRSGVRAPRESGGPHRPPGATRAGRPTPMARWRPRSHRVSRPWASCSPTARSIGSCSPTGTGRS